MHIAHATHAHTYTHIVTAFNFTAAASSIAVAAANEKVIEETERVPNKFNINFPISDGRWILLAHRAQYEHIRNDVSMKPNEEKNN